jgi:hypothetical protein
MNMQSMMQQAQKMQKEIARVKDEVDEKIFVNSKSFVEVKVNGKKELLDIKINKNTLDKDDIEALEDLVKLSVNETFKEIDKELDSKLGKFGMGSLGF